MEIKQVMAYATKRFGFRRKAWDKDGSDLEDYLSFRLEDGELSDTPFWVTKSETSWEYHFTYGDLVACDWYPILTSEAEEELQSVAESVQQTLEHFMNIHVDHKDEHLQFLKNADECLFLENVRVFYREDGLKVKIGDYSYHVVREGRKNV